MVTLTGTNLDGATNVSFGGSAGSISSDTATQITVTSPPGNAGTVSVTVTTPAGTSNALPFTYVPAPTAPTVTSLSPNCGVTDGGTSVMINGTDLAGATSVSFGGTPVKFTVDSAAQITATSPPGKVNTHVSVTVTTPGGTSNAVQFTYGCPIP